MADHATWQTFCRLCIANCGVEVDTEDGEPVAVRGDPTHPVSAGYTCNKGRALVNLHHAPNRLAGPLLRVGEELVPVTWDEALLDLDARLEDVVRRFGTGSVGFFTGGGTYTDAAGYWMSRRLQRRLATRNIYSDMSIDSAAKYRVGELMAGTYALAPHADPDAKLLIMLGTNPVVSHGQTPMFENPVMRIRAARSKGSVWVVDPRTTESARLADRHLAIRPGADYALLGWLVRSVLADMTETARSELSQRATGMAELADAVSDFDLPTAARLTGLTDRDLSDLLEAVRRAGRLAILTGTGVTMSPGGNAAEWLAWALLIVTDSFDRPGGMWFNPGYIARLDERESVPAAGPPEPGPPTRPEIARLMGEYPAAVIPDEVAAGNLRALFVLGGNVATALADTARVRAGLRELDLLVVLDIAHTATTELATHVLACRGQLERADLALLNDLFNPLVATQYSPAVAPNHPGRRPSWWLIAWIARSLGVEVLPSGMDPDEATDEDILALIAGEPLLDQLRTSPQPWIVGPSPRFGWVGERLPLGRWDLAPSALVEQMRSLGDSPPLVLTPRRQAHRINGTLIREGDRPEVLVHPKDAAAAGIVDGELVEVVSATGSLQINARVTEAIRPGAASIPHGWPDHNVNILISGRDIDLLTGMPMQSGLAIEIRPVSQAVK